MLKYQTADGKILMQGNADEKDVGFADAGLIIVDGKVYSVGDAARLAARVQPAIYDAKAWIFSAENAAKK